MKASVIPLVLLAMVLLLPQAQAVTIELNPLTPVARQGHVSLFNINGDNTTNYRVSIWYVDETTRVEEVVVPDGGDFITDEHGQHRLAVTWIGEIGEVGEKRVRVQEVGGVRGNQTIVTVEYDPLYVASQQKLVIVALYAFWETVKTGLIWFAIFQGSLVMLLLLRMWWLGNSLVDVGDALKRSWGRLWMVWRDTYNNTIQKELSTDKMGWHQLRCNRLYNRFRFMQRRYSHWRNVANRRYNALMEVLEQARASARIVESINPGNKHIRAIWALRDPEQLPEFPRVDQMDDVERISHQLLAGRAAAADGNGPAKKKRGRPRANG